MPINKSKHSGVIYFLLTQYRNVFNFNAISPSKQYRLRLFLVYVGMLIMQNDVHAQAALNWIKTLRSTSPTSGSYGLVATDKWGNIYLYGGIRGTVDMDPSPQTQTITSAGDNDIFFAKYTANGALIWSKRLGASNYDFAGSLMFDASENIIMVGQFSGTVDFNAGPGVFNLSSNGYTDIFVLKIDSSGNFIWAKSFGGKYSEGVMAKIDPNDNIIIAGSFFDTMDVDPGPNQFLLQYKGTGWSQSDPYIVKLDSSGQFVHAFSFGSIKSDGTSAIDIDSLGNLYIAGGFRDTIDMDPGPNVYTLIPQVGEELFIAKYSPTGQFIWAGAINGGDSIASDIILDIKFDHNGDFWICGEIKGPVDMDMGLGVLIANCPLGNSYAFATKYNNSGQVILSRVFKGKASMAYCLLVDAQNRVYIGGNFKDSTDFNDGPADFVIQNNPLVYADFIVCLNDNGNFLWALGFSQYITGGGQMGLRKMALDPQGNVLSSGYYYGAIDLDPGNGLVNIPSISQWYDCFVRKHIYYPTELSDTETHLKNSLYPCPAKNNVWISATDNTRIRIIDIYGRTIFIGTLNSPFPVQLDVSQFADGHYFVYLNDEVHRLQIMR
jgi:hypothetical protein